MARYSYFSNGSFCKIIAMFYCSTIEMLTFALKNVTAASHFWQCSLYGRRFTTKSEYSHSTAQLPIYSHSFHLLLFFHCRIADCQRTTQSAMQCRSSDWIRNWIAIMEKLVFPIRAFARLDSNESAWSKRWKNCNYLPFSWKVHISVLHN